MFSNYAFTKSQGHLWAPNHIQITHNIHVYLPADLLKNNNLAGKELTLESQVDQERGEEAMTSSLLINYPLK